MSEAGPPSPPARSLAGPVAALVVLAFAAVLFRTAWLSDDSLISLRTVLNVTHGNGLTFNVGERVQTFTHPLWLGLLTAGYLVVGNVYYAAFALSIAVSLWVFWLAVSRAASPWQGWLAAAALLSSRAFVDYSTSGLENPLANLIAALLVAMFLRRDTAPRRRLAGLWGLASLLYLARPDLVLIAAPLLLSATWRAWRDGAGARTVAGAVALGLLPALAWTAFAVVYYGFPFPNTAYAKLGMDIERAQLWKQGVIYAIDSLDRDPLTLVLVAFACVMAVPSRVRGARELAAGIAIYALYVASIGGDFMSGRFFAVPFFAAVLLLTRMTSAARPAWIAAVAASVVLGAASAKAPLLSDSRFEDRGTKHGGIVDERVFYLKAHSLVYASMMSFADPDWRARRPPGETRVLNTCGLMGEGGLDFGPHYYLLDECALADPLLARLPAIFKEEWRPGHFRRVVPEGYRESVASGANRIKDPQLREFYGRLSLITRSRTIWSRDRLWAIWQMNTGRYDRLVDRDFYRFGGFVKTLAEMSDVKAPETPWDAPGNTVLTQPLAVRVERRPGRRYADVSLDSDDKYALIFVKGNAAVGHLLVEGYAATDEALRARVAARDGVAPR